MKANSVGMWFLIGVAACGVSQAADDDGTWAGFSIGGGFGYAWQRGTARETILFDTNADGAFNDTVSTLTGANAFSPGFCGGFAFTNVPANSCRGDHNGVAWRVNAGYDWQRSHWVYGAHVDIGQSNIDDSVSAFSTTPAAYAFTREIEITSALRGRVGWAWSSTLFYATGGVAYAKIDNRFTTSNTTNAFTPNDEDDAWGWVGGIGVEQRMSEHLSAGVEALYSSYDTGDFTVNASRGAASASNPFVIAPAGSVNFIRSEPDYENIAVKLTLNYRF